MAKTYWRGRQHNIEGVIVALFVGIHDSGRRTGSNPVVLDGRGEWPTNYNYPKHNHINGDDLARKIAEEYKNPVPKR